MSAGIDHCKFTNGGLRFKCNHCEVVGGAYDSESTCQRMASNHIVKKHPDIAKPASQQDSEPNRPYTRKPKSAALGVNFCPSCGCNLNAVRVAISL